MDDLDVHKMVPIVQKIGILSSNDNHVLWDSFTIFWPTSSMGMIKMQLILIELKDSICLS